MKRHNPLSPELFAASFKTSLKARGRTKTMIMHENKTAANIKATTLLEQSSITGYHPISITSISEFY